VARAIRCTNFSVLGRQAVAAGVEVAADEIPEVAGVCRLSRRAGSCSAKRRRTTRIGSSAPWRHCSPRLGEHLVVPLPGLRQRQQDAGAEGALAAAGGAEQRQLAVFRQRFERRHGARRAFRVLHFRTRVARRAAAALQPLRQRRLLRDVQLRRQRHIDVGELQRLAPAVAGAEVDLAEPAGRRDRRRARSDNAR
jgi:hypothetical protein